ncbi:hypothetical protein [Cognataquiflexum rubidum]|uniref:hypothetical protein n=1 Tax=Cognataquiflexum rubidum TaxID=2922273 RepID=UPI001F128CA4|nr:hypothetical protein [Cognataquiflexum rubidum]MCH6233049.1 hypothetical protein [Cognataquiflexum rubidum]
MLKKYFLFILLAVSLFSCKEKEKEQVKPVPVTQPKQDAPLALLMREMYLDMEEMKVSLEKKENIKSYLEKHQALLTAKPTDPKVKDATFDQMAIGYLESLRQLGLGPYELKVSKYKIVYNYCIACHEKYCPGPIKKITNLQIE